MVRPEDAAPSPLAPPDAARPISVLAARRAADLIRLQAQTRSWVVRVDPDTAALRLHAPDGLSGAAYVPPSSVSTGCLSAHNERQTLTMTGVETHTEAVRIIAGFFDWALPGAIMEAASGIRCAERAQVAL